jgi:hypothetical protein
MSINKFTTLLDLSRQAKIITGETATFDGKIEAGIPFSGYPTGVDTGTTVSLGVVSTQTAVFSGNTGTTKFDVSNSSSPNYNIAFSSYTATTWTNPIFSAQTSGLTLPITTLSADTQIVGPFWTLTQTGYTGEYIIGTQYTGYSITYSFNGVTSTLSGTSFSGFTTASQENFSAGTLDYKGPLDYLQSVEDATIDGRLYTNKISISNGASASTIGYVLTQTGSNGEGEWLPNSSADTNTYVTGGTLSGTSLLLNWNNGGSANPINLSSLSGGTFTGNTSGDCIGDIFVSNIHSCSPLWINPLNEGDIVFGTNKSFYIDVTNNRLGIGKTPSLGTIDITGPNGNFIYRPSGAAVSLTLSGDSNKVVYNAMLSNDNGIFTGVNGSGTTSNFGGSFGDSFIYTQGDIDNLNISTPSSFFSGSKNIRFYAGQGAISASTPDIHIQGSGSTRGYIGINTPNPEYLLDVVNTNSRLLYDPTTVGGRLTISGKTNLPRFGVEIPSYLIKPQASASLGMRAWDDLLYPDYGNPGDVHLYAGVNAYGLNIISQYGATSADYIRFYAGQGADSGNTPDIHIQGSGSTRGYIGINTSNPEYLLDVVNTNSRLYYDPTSAGGRLNISGTTGLPRFGISIPPYLTKPTAGGSLGIRTWDDVTSPGYGKVGDMHLYAGNDINGLNIINRQGTGAEDYIRFYAGQDANGTTPDIHIQGSGVTKGYVGIGTETPTERLTVSGTSFFKTSSLTTGTSPSFYYLDGVSTPTDTSTIKSIYKEFRPTTTSSSNVVGDGTLLYPNITSPTNGEFYSKANLILYTGDLSLLNSNEALTSESNVVQIQTNTGTYNDIVKSSSSVLRNLTAGGTINEYVGFWMNGFDITLTHNGSTNNIYGFYMDDQSTRSGNIPPPTNRWGIYIKDAGYNYIAGYLGIGTTTPSEKLDVSGKTKTTDFQMTNGATNGYVLTSDGSGNATWQVSSGGGSSVTTATTTTINFTGQTIYYNSTSPATGNITNNLTSANLGLIQKIYHNDTSEPTYPAGWVLMGDAIYFTSTLNIIYAEWAGGTRVEYWYVQEQ